MSMPIDPTLAQRLRDSGNVSDNVWENWSKNFAASQSKPVAPVMVDEDPTEPVATPVETALVPNADGSFIGDLTDPDADKKAAIAFKESAMSQRQREMKALGVSDEDIEAKLLPERQTLEQQKRGLMLTGEQSLGDGIQLTTDMPTDTPAQVDPRDQVPSIPVLAGYDLQQEAIGMAGQAGAAKAAEIGAAQAQLQIDLKDQSDAAEAQRIKDQQEIADKQSELSAEIDRVSALKVDPSRFWADKSTGQKIALGASLFLGALGAARGGGNQAAAVINNAINRDLEMQQADIIQQTRGVDKKRGILGEMKSRFKDDRMAREAARMAYINDAQLKIQEMSNKYDSQIVKANAAKLIGQLEVQKQTAQAQFMQSFQQSKPVGPDANIGMLDKDQRERFVPGYGLALTKDSAKLARESVSTMDSIKGNIDELMALSNKSGASFSPTDRARAETITSILTGQLRLPIVGPGAVSEKELELLQRIIADPTKIMSLDNTNKARLQTLRQRMDKQTANQLKQYGLQSPNDKLGFQPLK